LKELKGTAMKAFVRSPRDSDEFLTSERCRILEVWNNQADKAASIARARVTAGITTQLHRLKGVEERYLIVKGTGLVKIGDLGPATVVPGDVAVIPANVAQQITNTGREDLVFYCICTPRFSPDCYESLE